MCNVEYVFISSILLGITAVRHPGKFCSVKVEIVLVDCAIAAYFRADQSIVSHRVDRLELCDVL